MSDYKGEQLLDKLYNDLYNSKPVQHKRKNKDRREESIRRYMNRLEHIQEQTTTKHRADLIKKIYFDRYIIKEENIPTTMDANIIISSQKNSLSKWIDYLIEENEIYPMWAKYWIFRGMIKMGSYDDLRGIYNKRSSRTTAPFIDVNPLLIAKCFDNVIKILHKDELSKEELNKLIDSECFQRLYTIFEKQSKKERNKDLTSNDGIWIKYNMGNYRDAIKLANSLAKANVEWCTATKEIAVEQICGGSLYQSGDFYVYYTEKDGELIVPRIAIRLNGHNNIGEIRGIAECQNIEKCMKKKLEEKLQEMKFLNDQDVKEAIEKMNKLEELYLIGQKTVNNISLNEDEIIKLYTEEYGFGTKNDPLVKRIKEIRNINEDYKKLFNKDKKIKFMQIESLELSSVEDNQELLIEAASNGHYDILNCASKQLKSNKNFILKIIDSSEAYHLNSNDHHAIPNFSNISIFECISKELIKDKELILSIIEKIPSEAKNIDSELLKDKKNIKEIIDRNPQSFRYFNYEIRNDKEIALFAINKDPQTSLYIGVDIKYNADINHLCLKVQEEENKRVLRHI